MATSNIPNPNTIPVYYSSAIPIIYSNSQNGSYTAPKDGFAVCNIIAGSSGYIDVYANSHIVGTQNTQGGTVCIIPLKQGDKLTWSGSNSNCYMRGDNNRSYFA